MYSVYERNEEKKNQGRREEGKEKMKTEKKTHITNYAFSTNKRIFQ